MQSVQKRIAEYRIVGLSSHWIEDSNVRVRVRTTKKDVKIMVDIMELSPEGCEVERTKLNALAIAAAIYHGAASTDFCVIRDYLTSRKAMRVDGTMTYTNIREKSYVFRGVE